MMHRLHIEGVPVKQMRDFCKKTANFVMVTYYRCTLYIQVDCLSVIHGWSTLCPVTKQIQLKGQLYNCMLAAGNVITFILR